jgi:hypothetical protein
VLARQIHISFVRQSISDKYVVSLIDVLKNRRSTVTLAFVECEISHESLKLIVGALPDMHHLTGLKIVQPKCMPSWLLALEHGLPGNTSLTRLEIKVSKTDVKHAKGLARGLRRNRSLEQVKIELDYRTQVLIVLKSLLGTLHSENAPDTSQCAGPDRPVPRLRTLTLHANKKATGYGGERFNDNACRLLKRLIDERTLLERIELVPGLWAIELNKKILADLGRAADRHMVDLNIDMRQYAAPPLDISELRRRQQLFASPAALRAAIGSLNFIATQDGIPLHTDVMSVIASHLTVQGPLRAAWVLRGLLSVNKKAREEVDSARSSAHAKRLLQLLNSKPARTKKGIAHRKKKAIANALADMWRLCLAGMPLCPEDQARVTRATASSAVWKECRSLVAEKVTRLSRQHRETRHMLKKNDPPKAAYAKELGRSLNSPGLPHIGMSGLL